MTPFTKAVFQSLFYTANALWLLWRTVNYFSAHPDLFMQVCKIVGCYVLVGCLLLGGAVLMFFSLLCAAASVRDWCVQMLGGRKRSCCDIILALFFAMLELGLFSFIFLNMHTALHRWLTREESLPLWLLYYVTLGLHALFALYLLLFVWFQLVLSLYSSQLVTPLRAADSNRSTVVRIKELAVAIGGD